jgi:hypothetical protein
MKYLNALVIFVIIACFAMIDAYSIPAFARKYKLSCQTCHLPIPRLKPYGDEFAGNAFKLTDKEAPRYYVETGDEELSLIRDFPIAVRMDAHVMYNNNSEDKSDFGVPYMLKLMSGGELANDIAYYFYFYMNERGDVAGVEDAYIMFNNLFGSELDVYIGQFQVSDPLFKRELRLTLEDYNLYKVRPGNSRINLAYDRGIMLTYGFDTGTDIMFEVINGSGLNAADGSKIFDNDEYKNVMGRVSQDVFDFFRVGAFGYYGKEALLVGPETIPIEFTNEMNMVGFDFSLAMTEYFELNFQFVERFDKHIIDPNEVTNEYKGLVTQGIMSELVFIPNGDDSKWYAAGMFNWTESKDMGYLYRTATAHAGYMLKRNLRLVAEGTFDFSDCSNKYTRFSLGIVSAF